MLDRYIAENHSKQNKAQQITPIPNGSVKPCDVMLKFEWPQIVLASEVSIPIVIVYSITSCTIFQ